MGIDGLDNLQHSDASDNHLEQAPDAHEPGDEFPPELASEISSPHEIVPDEVDQNPPPGDGVLDPISSAPDSEVGPVNPSSPGDNTQDNEALS